MEPTAIKALVSAEAVLYVYGPLGVLSLLGFVLFFLERKCVRELTDKLTELSGASIKADMEHTRTYEAMERALESTTRLLAERK